MERSIKPKIMLETESEEFGYECMISTDWNDLDTPADKFGLSGDSYNVEIKSWTIITRCQRVGSAIEKCDRLRLHYAFDRFDIKVL